MEGPDEVTRWRERRTCRDPSARRTCRSITRSGDASARHAESTRIGWWLTEPNFKRARR